MRKLIFILMSIAGAFCFIASCARYDEVPKIPVTLYYVDAQMNRLLPYEDEIIDADAEHTAQAALDKLIAGRDDNDKIRRLIPNIPGCLKSRVENTVAYVDIASEITEHVTYGRDIEKLIIYQIVDTLTELKGIRFVKFTIDGSVHKDFMGYYDMRDTYKRRYPE